jgi:hypothetical protein
LWGFDAFTRKNIESLLSEEVFGGIGGRAQFIDEELIPTINQQGIFGWELTLSLQAICLKFEEAGNTEKVNAIRTLMVMILYLGHYFFRIHPKGRGVVCNAPEGFSSKELICEYVGQLYLPWQWSEKEEETAKTDGLTDFYNITLERPHDDEAGYDVLHVDPIDKGNFSSRLSHSCNPNCFMTVMAASGRLMIAVLTLRSIKKGEELTFDYNCITDNKEEFDRSVCLCGSQDCRGYFLNWAGKSTFQEVMSKDHHFLNRNAIAILSCIEEYCDEDQRSLEKNGIKSSMLQSAPNWLRKWTSLISRFIENESDTLPSLLHNRVQKSAFVYEMAQAEQDTKGVTANRLQNLAISCDKVLYVIQLYCEQAKTDQGEVEDAYPPAPFRQLEPLECVRMLWTGEQAVARTVLDGMASKLCTDCAACRGHDETESAMRSEDGAAPECALANARNLWKEPADNRQQVRELLLRLRELILEEVGIHAIASADLLFLCANTEHWIQYAEFPVVHGSLRQERKYGQNYIWGQLTSWYEQTQDSAADSVVAHGRGLYVLPSVASALGVDPAWYVKTARAKLLDQMTSEGASWPASKWKAAFPASAKDATRLGFTDDGSGLGGMRRICGGPILDHALAVSRGGNSAKDSKAKLAGIAKQFADAALPSLPIAEKDSKRKDTDRDTDKDVDKDKEGGSKRFTRPCLKPIRNDVFESVLEEFTGKNYKSRKLGRERLWELLPAEGKSKIASLLGLTVEEIENATDDVAGPEATMLQAE